MAKSLNITILGLSITSSGCNKHTTTYRRLVRELAKTGHKIIFLEKNFPEHSKEHRDLPAPDFCETYFYQSFNELKEKHTAAVQNADLVIVGSYVPEGVSVGEWVNKTAKGITVFYDIDTPVTLAKLEKGDYEYLAPELIPLYNIYLSFTGGPVLEYLEEHFGSPMARPLFCSFDPEQYFPEDKEKKWDLGYLGAYSDDRQSPLESLMLNAARQWQEGKFVVAGAPYPDNINWPENVERIGHLQSARHRDFYNDQQFTLNITRQDMKKWGYTPNIHLFEAAACATPIISDNWQGLDTIFEIETEILVSYSAEDTLNYFKYLNEDERIAIGEAARQKVLKNHTAAHRVQELIQYYEEAKSAAPEV